MKFLMLSLLSCFVMADPAPDKKDKGLAVDRIECTWNKTPEEIKEKCKPDASKPTIANKLDSRLKQDAKTLKKFFGIGGKESKENEQSKDTQ